MLLVQCDRVLLNSSHSPVIIAWVWPSSALSIGSVPIILFNCESYSKVRGCNEDEEWGETRLRMLTRKMKANVMRDAMKQNKNYFYSVWLLKFSLFCYSNVQKGLSGIGVLFCGISSSVIPGLAVLLAVVYKSWALICDPCRMPGTWDQIIISGLPKLSI